MWYSPLAADDRALRISSAAGTSIADADIITSLIWYLLEVADVE